MDPITISALIIGIISALGIAILSICKVIKRSSCCWGVIKVRTDNDKSDEKAKGGSEINESIECVQSEKTTPQLSDPETIA